MRFILDYYTILLELCAGKIDQEAIYMLVGQAAVLPDRGRHGHVVPTLLQLNRQIERAAETESVPAHARGIRQGHFGEALEQHG